MQFHRWDVLNEAIPRLSSSEFEALKESIKKHGLKYPIKVLPDGRIIDGFHRWLVVGDNVPYEVIDVDEATALELGLSLNADRRQLSPEQLTVAREKLKAIYAQLREDGKTQKDAAKIVGVSRNTGYAWENAGSVVPKIPDLRVKVPKEEYPRIYERVETGETEESVAADYKITQKRVTQIVGAHKKFSEHAEQVRELEQKAKVLPLPERRYSVLVVDPPWPYGTNYDPESRRVGSPYQEIDIDEIKALKLPAADDCVLWLWTTNAFLHEAYHVLEAWGFEPKTVLTWAKDRIGVGVWLRGQTEHCIMAVKGNPVVHLYNQSTLLLAPSRAHSEKPDEFYSLVESLCEGPRLDYFARKERLGWDTFGTMEDVK